MEEGISDCTWGATWCLCLLALQISARFLKNQIYPLYFSVEIIAANKYLHKPQFRQSFPLKIMSRSCAVMNFHVLTATSSSSATGSAVSMNVPLPLLQRYELLFEMLGICCSKCLEYKKAFTGFSFACSNNQQEQNLFLTNCMANCFMPEKAHSSFVFAWVEDPHL